MYYSTYCDAAYVPQDPLPYMYHKDQPHPKAANTLISPTISDLPTIIVLYLTHKCVVAVVYCIAKKNIFMKTETKNFYREILLLCPVNFLEKYFQWVHICILLHVVLVSRAY